MDQPLLLVQNKNLWLLKPNKSNVRNDMFLGNILGVSWKPDLKSFWQEIIVLHPDMRGEKHQHGGIS